MKITITHTDAEERQAAQVLAALARLLPGARVHRAAPKPPFSRLYLTTRRGPGP